ncbi:hypothetical protein C7M84_012448 [Penaeus vannamei]|uniref:Uncharacterized protein n=1 Tax=Penaeus vannamei TaxID=6689 RepID=A0A3R7MTF4_PENVA|nr:hypothetical protein C7M84_012448 [Penaeus vannamei]
MRCDFLLPFPLSPPLPISSFTRSPFPSPLSSSLRSLPTFPSLPFLLHSLPLLSSSLLSPSFYSSSLSFSTPLLHFLLLLPITTFLPSPFALLLLSFLPSILLYPYHSSFTATTIQSPSSLLFNLHSSSLSTVLLLFSLPLPRLFLLWPFPPPSLSFPYTLIHHLPLLSPHHPRPIHPFLFSLHLISFTPSFHPPLKHLSLLPSLYGPLSFFPSPLHFLSHSLPSSTLTHPSLSPPAIHPSTPLASFTLSLSVVLCLAPLTFLFFLLLSSLTSLVSSLASLSGFLPSYSLLLSPLSLLFLYFFLNFSPDSFISLTLSSLVLPLLFPFLASLLSSFTFLFSPLVFFTSLPLLLLLSCSILPFASVTFFSCFSLPLFILPILSPLLPPSPSLSLPFVSPPHSSFSLFSFHPLPPFSSPFILYLFLTLLFIFTASDQVTFLRGLTSFSSPSWVPSLFPFPLGYPSLSPISLLYPVVVPFSSLPLPPGALLSSLLSLLPSPRTPPCSLFSLSLHLLPDLPVSLPSFSPPQNPSTVTFPLSPPSDPPSLSPPSSHISLGSPHPLFPFPRTISPSPLHKAPASLPFSISPAPLPLSRSQSPRVPPSFPVRRPPPSSAAPIPPPQWLLHFIKSLYAFLAEVCRHGAALGLIVRE